MLNWAFDFITKPETVLFCLYFLWRFMCDWREWSVFDNERIRRRTAGYAVGTANEWACARVNGVRFGLEHGATKLRRSDRFFVRKTEPIVGGRTNKIAVLLQRWWGWGPEREIGELGDESHWSFLGECLDEGGQIVGHTILFGFHPDGGRTVTLHLQLKCDSDASKKAMKQLHDLHHQLNVDSAKERRADFLLEKDRRRNAEATVQSTTKGPPE